MTTTLFDLIPHNGTETSMAAASRQTLGKVDRDLAEIRKAFVNRGDHGFTREELSEVTGILPNSINPRTRHLINIGELVPKKDGNGSKVKRNTKSGSPAQVLIHTWHAHAEEHARP